MRRDRVAVGWLIPALYGPGLGRVVVLVRALAPAIVAVFLGYLFTQALVVLDLQRRYLAIAIAGLAVNVACNLALIPFLEGVGAAIATVVTEVLVTVAAGVAALRAPARAATATDEPLDLESRGLSGHGAGSPTGIGR